MSEAKDKNVTKPLYATVGATDLAIQAVAEVVAKVRERAENTSTDVSGRVDEARERFSTIPADVQDQIDALRDRLAGLPAELPDELAELREKFTVDELRRVADSYLKVAVDLYADLAERGEGAVERLRTKPSVDARIEKAEGFYSDAVSLTEEALGKVSERTRAVGEQAVKFAGRASTRVAAIATGTSVAAASAMAPAAIRTAAAGPATATSGSPRGRVTAKARTATSNAMARISAAVLFSGRPFSRFANVQA